MEDNLGQTWRTAGYTGNGGGNCVEVGHAAGVIVVRDTKDRGGLMLNVPADAWASFITSLK
jgi:hypothetical protein